MKESKYSRDSRLVFRETFNSFDDIARNGGTLGSSVVLSNGNGVFSYNPTTSFILYNKYIPSSTYSIRMKIYVNDITINNQYLFDSRLNSGTGYIYQSSGVLTASAGTRYVNGIVSSTITNGYNEVLVTGITLMNTQILLGRRFGYTVNQGLGGSIDLVEIYKGVLTPTEVQCLYNNNLYTEPNLDANTVLDINPNLGNFSDKKGHTVTNTAVSLVKAKNSYVGSYNGTSSRIVVADTPDINFGDGAGNDKPFSIECWIKFSQLEAALKYISCKSTGIGGFVLVRSNAYAYQFILYSYDTGSAYIRRLTGVRSDITNWLHIIATYDGNKSSTGLKIYINGVQSDTTTANAGTYLGLGTSTSYNIGNGSSVYTAANIGRHRLFNKELTQEEITRLYNSQKGLYR